MLVESAGLLESKSERQKKVVCTHCGLPVPGGLIEEGCEQQFCCAGCKAAFQLIHSCGLDAFYAMADSSAPSLLRDDEEAQRPFDEFDLDSFFDKFGNRISDEVCEMTLLLDGIHCAACIWLLEKLPQMIPGVLDVKLNWARQSALIRWQSQEVQLSRIARTLHQLGYSPHPVRESEKDHRRHIENRKHLIRIGIAAAAAGNNMLITASLYLGMFSYMSVGMTQLMRIASCVVGLVSLFWPGRIFLAGAINAIKTRTPHMDLPIALGLTMGSCVGLINTLRGTGEIYFDSISVLIFLLLVGRWIQFRQQNRASDAVEALYRMTPRKTRKVVGGKTQETFVDLVKPGDLLEIRNGELVPVDALITKGETEIDESILSGESRLHRRGVGEQVLAGTQNRLATIIIKAEATGRDTRLSKILDLVEQAAMDKPEVVQLANRIGGYFVVSVIGLAALTWGAWLMINPVVAVDRAVALLIVACPCALALATPLAVSVALGRAAKRKIMIKGGDVLQWLGRPGMIWLDKTGTLTLGNLDVVEWVGDSSWLTAVAALESNSSHPAATAILRYAERHSVEAVNDTVADFREHFGEGVSGSLGEHSVLVGNKSLLAANEINVDSHWQAIADRMLNATLSPCWVAVDGKVVVVFALGDQIRADAADSIALLKRNGWEIGILSGDEQKIVDQVANQLGIGSKLAVGGMSPESKVDVVQNSLDEFSTVVMVGDGVNDSAALAAASVGIAVHSGAEASLAAAPVYLGTEGLRPILELMRISESTGRTIRRNFAASVSYNVLGATMAILGWINPLVAAILMPVSSLTVVGISLTAGKTTEKGKR